MQPDDQQQSDSVWISKEEYQRLQSLDSQAQVATGKTAEVRADEEDYNKQHRWQVLLGVILALVLYFSVVSGSGANWFLVLAIIIFGSVSLVDYVRAQKAKQTGQKLAYKHNPFKWFAIILFAVTVVPFLGFMLLLILFFTLGGGDVGS
jgi:hypothetical protein